MIGIARQCHGTFLEHGTDSAAAVEDIDSAYHQIDVAQCDQWLQCCSFSGGVSGIWVSGFFGSNVAGSAFGATGRLALEDIRRNGAPHRATAATSTSQSSQTPAEAKRRKIRCSLVVDDALVTGHRDEIVPSITGSVEEVGGIDYVQHVFRSLYGPTAVSGKKTRVAVPSRPSGEALQLNNGAYVENSGSEITYIGWILDFVRGGFGVKPSNLARTARTLISVINDGTVSVHTLLRASAQVGRLQMVISPLRLVSRALASQVFMSRGCYWRNLEAKLTVQASTRQAARLALSWIVDFAERDARTPFRSLAALKASVLIVSDASSKGFGWLIYRRTEPVDELEECANYHEFCSDNESAAAEVHTDQEISRVVEECHNDGIPFDIGRIDSSYELIAAGALPMPYDIMAILGAEEKPSKKFKSGLQNTWEFLAHTIAMAALGFCGVSSTSVTAVFDSVTAKKWSSGVTTGRLSRVAMLLHAAVSLDCELTVAKTVCIGTLDMQAADLLSREDPVIALEQLGIPKEKWLFPTQRLVELLDPRIEWPENDDAEFLRLWQYSRDSRCGQIGWGRFSASNVPEACFVPSKEARAAQRRSLSVNTVRNPQTVWALWEQFYYAREEAQYFDAVGNSHPGVRSRSASGLHATTAEWAVLLSEWQLWLQSLPKKRAPEGARTALKRIFTECRAESEVVAAFSLPHVTATARGIRNKIPQRIRAKQREERQQHPVTNDVLYKAWEFCETGFNLREKSGIGPSSWHKESWYRFLSVLGCWTAKQYELRACEYCHTPAKIRHGETDPRLRVVVDDHSLRPEDVFVVLRDGERIAAADMCQYASIRIEEVDFLVFYLRSAKNIRDGNYVVEYARPSVGPMMTDFVWMHLTFMQFSRWQKGDIYFSMRYPLGEGLLKQLIPKMVVDITRAAVEHLGGNKMRYGTRSLKIGGITDLYHAGASEADLLALGRHASVAANRHYRRTIVDENVLRAGPLALGEDRALTLDAVARGSPDAHMRRVPHAPRRGGQR